jgi:hypothetical protein
MGNNDVKQDDKGTQKSNIRLKNHGVKDGGIA